MIDDPELDGTDDANPAYWRGHDDAVVMLCQKLNEILAGKDDGKGVTSEPWEPVRRRLLALRGNEAMTALERALSVVTAFAERPEATPDEHTRWLVDAIHRAIIEHNNAVEARAKKAAAIIRTLEDGVLLRGKDWGGGETARLAEAALKALEGK